MTQTKQLATSIISLQHHYSHQWHIDDAIQRPTDPLEALVVAQHKRNFDLWHEEDKARDPKASDSTIAQVKRNIDQFNQQRNDMITELDVQLEKSLFSGVGDSQQRPWNSETIGSIIDRLSIASLKVFHMQEQVERVDADAAHIESCKQKVYQLEVQRQDLSTALQLFIDDVLAGRKQNKLYRQFKMYNDPSLNPKMYRKG